MTHLLAIIAFALAVIFYGWGISHGVWTYTFMALWGLLLMALSAHPKWPY